MKRRTLLVLLWTTAAMAAAGSLIGPALASIRPMPLPELVRTSTVILSGRIVRTEATVIRDGVTEGTAYLQPDRILMGAPRYTTVRTDTATKETREIAFHYSYGPGLPSGGSPPHQVGEEGVWYLVFVPRSDALRYGATGGYSVLTPESPYGERAALPQIETEIRRRLLPKNR